MTHEMLQTYIDGNRDIVSAEERENNSQIQLLLDQVDNALTVVSVNKSEKTADERISFEKTEEIISSVLAGTESKSSQQQFLDLLYASPDFYERVMIKLNELVPVMEGTLDEELREVAVRDDDEVLQELGIGNSELGDSKAKPDKSGILEKLSGWIGSVPRYAYAVGGSSLVILLSYFGVRFYNTTYQIILAEDILKENYRVYSVNMPRLSGEYESTPEEQLMSDSDIENYKEEVLEYINHALEYNSSSSRILKIQSHIYIINNEFRKAEQIFEQYGAEHSAGAMVLNDKSVLKFLQGEYQSSEELLNLAIQIDPDIPEAYYNLAIVQEKLGKRSESVQTMNKFLTLNTDEGWKRAAEKFIIDNTD